MKRATGCVLMVSGLLLSALAFLMLIGWATDPERDAAMLFVVGVPALVAAAILVAGFRCFRKSNASSAHSSLTGAAETVHEPVATAATQQGAITPKSPETAEVIKNLLEINNCDLPFRVIDGGEEGVDLIAEWNLVDVKWRDLAMKRGVKKVFRIFMKFDQENREVRAVDREYSVDWSAGIPVLGDPGGQASAEFFRGQKWESDFQAEFRIEDVLRFLAKLLLFRWEPPKPVYSYSFHTEEMKAPLREAAARAGWTWKPVVFAKL